jgi:hypothetical protein
MFWKSLYMQRLSASMWVYRLPRGPLISGMKLLGSRWPVDHDSIGQSSSFSISRITFAKVALLRSAAVMYVGGMWKCAVAESPSAATPMAPVPLHHASSYVTPDVASTPEMLLQL